MTATFDTPFVRGLGWRRDIEDRDYLFRSSSTFRLRGRVTGPVSWSHRNWLRVEDQGQQSSCYGHASTSCLEVLNWIATGGSEEQLCRQFAYVTAQKIDGIQGDNGATISGGVKALLTKGICRESLWPYSGKYNPNPPQACFAEALQHRIRQSTKLKSAKECEDYLRSGSGTIVFGTGCVQSIMDSKGKIDRLSGRSAGGHAMCWVAMQEGWFDGPNSWGTGWGDNGWSLWSPQVVEHICNDPQSEVIGISDLEAYGEQRPVSLVGVFR